MNEIIEAPWTFDQVKSLNTFQIEGWFHPFTCGKCNRHVNLIATEEGWVCPKCDYTQSWAHIWMVNWGWRASKETLRNVLQGKEQQIDVCARPDMHDLKTWPEYYKAITAEKRLRKTVEIRKDDRDFKVGDYLLLREYDPEKKEYTGEFVYRLITHCFKEQPWIPEGYVAMSISELGEF